MTLALLALTLLLSAAAMLDWFLRRPVQSLCAALKPDTTPELLVKEANRLGLRSFDHSQTRGYVRVLNHDSPYFRFAREASFDHGRLTGSRVIAAD